MKRQKSLPLLTQFGFKQEIKEILLFLIKSTVTAKATFWASNAQDYTLEHADIQNFPEGGSPDHPCKRRKSPSAPSPYVAVPH